MKSLRSFFLCGCTLQSQRGIHGTCIHVDGRNHQLRYIKLFQSWDIFPYQPPGTIPPTDFFPCWRVTITSNEIPDKLGPGMRKHGSRGETACLKKVVAELGLYKGCLPFFWDLFLLWYYWFSPTWCIEVILYTVYRHIPATFHLFDVFISSNLLLFERVLAYLAGYFLRGIHYEFIYHHLVGTVLGIFAKPIAVENLNICRTLSPLAI